jgi:hypothetical protein
MRAILVIVFFVALHVSLRPAPPAGVADRVTPPPAGTVEASRPADGPAEPARGGETGAREAPALAASASTADLPAQTLSLLPGAAGPTGTLDTAGEQRTSAHAAPRPDDRGVDVYILVQRELTRLACLAGDPETKWGKRSRAALRRFADRAKPKPAGNPDEALLRVLRGYPANYCKLCRPGQAACNIEATGSLPKRSQNQPAGQPADAAASYLPPWMQGRLASADEGPVQSDAADGPPAPQVKKKRRRAASGLSRPRQAAPARRRADWPFTRGWPRLW